MKKLIILLALMLNLVPYFNNKGSLTFGPSTVSAQYGNESEEDNSNDINIIINIINDILTSDDYPADHYVLDFNDDGSIDIYVVDSNGNTEYAGTMEENGAFYFADGLIGNTPDPNEPYNDVCNPACSNYNIEACDVENCDPTSNNYDQEYCDESNCDPGSVNFDQNYCNESNCDPYSVNYDETYCESLCDPSLPNFNQESCDASNCIEGSPNFDQAYCDGSNCDSYSTNYDPVYCNESKCDPYSSNYSANECDEDDCNGEDPETDLSPSGNSPEENWGQDDPDCHTGVNTIDKLKDFVGFNFGVVSLDWTKVTFHINGENGNCNGTYNSTTGMYHTSNGDAMGYACPNATGQDVYISPRGLDNCADLFIIVGHEVYHIKQYQQVKEPYDFNYYENAAWLWTHEAAVENGWDHWARKAEFGFAKYPVPDYDLSKKYRICQPAKMRK